MRPVYVGKAGFGKSDLFARLKAHDTDHLAARWKYFSWFGAYKVSARKVPAESTRILVHAKPTKWLKPAQLIAGIREIETVLVQVVEPSLNKRSGDWIDAEEFHQLVDERLEVNSLTAVAANQRELLRAFAKLEAKLKKK